MPENFGYCIGIDMVGFSKKSVSHQEELVKDLKVILKKHVRPKNVISTGDGAYIVFNDENVDVLNVLQTAINIMEDLHKKCTGVSIRMGIASGVIIPHKDMQGKSNFIGDGINLTARIMDCGNEWHILLSQLVAMSAEKHNKLPRGYYIVHAGEYLVKHALVLDVYALMGSNTPLWPNRELPVKNRINWEQLHKESTHIIFPKMED